MVSILRFVHPRPEVFWVWFDWPSGKLTKVWRTENPPWMNESIGFLMFFSYWKLFFSNVMLVFWGVLSSISGKKWFEKRRSFRLNFWTCGFPWFRTAMGDSHPQLGVNLKHLWKTTLDERKLILDGSIFYFEYGRKGTILFKVSETSTIRHNISNISQAGIVPTQLGNFCEPRSGCPANTLQTSLLKILLVKRNSTVG